MCVEARLVAEGLQDPDLTGELADTSGCFSLLSSHLQVVSLSTVRKWEFWSIDIENAFLQADGFGWDACLRAPAEWGPTCATRLWKLKAPAYGLNDAPAALRRSLKRYLLNSDLSMKCAGLRCQAPAFDPMFILCFPGSEAGGRCVRHPH